MLAEDDEKQAELVRRYLERENHRIVVAHDGRTALDEVRRLQPDLLVLDVMLPVWTGWTSAGSCAASPSCRY